MFMDTVTRMPNALAEIFGFKSAVYVHDHFDVTMVVLSDFDRFPDSDPVILSDLICEAAAGAPCFFASKNDDEFLREFPLESITVLSTKRIVAAVEEKDLCVPSPVFRVTFDMCLGCPGYCALYQRLAGLVKTAEERPAARAGSKYVSTVDAARRTLINQEFLRLCMLIDEAKNDDIDMHVWNELSASPTFQVRGR
jgi:hypothetical protein